MMKLKLLDYKKIEDSSPLVSDLFKKNGRDDRSLEIFLGRISESGVAKLNVSVSVAMEEHLIFCNSANEYNIINQAIITAPGFKEDQANTPLTILSIYMPDEEDANIGISGMAYSSLNDCLVFAASTTNIKPANNAAVNGKAGDALSANKKAVASRSYIGIIENAARKIGRKKMRVNSLIEFSSLEKKMKGFTPGQVFIQSEKNGKLKASIRANNDKGVAYLVKIRVKF